MQSLETLTERDFDSVWEIMEESFPRDDPGRRRERYWMSPGITCTGTVHMGN